MRGRIAGAVGVLLAVLSVAAPASAELSAAKPLGYTGGEQTYTVPAGVTWLAITAAGAPGWDTTTNQTGSVGDNNDGYEVYGMLAVTPGEQLFAEVGQAGLASGAATFGAGGAGSGGNAASAAPSGDFLNSLGGDGCTEGQTLHSCATEAHTFTVFNDWASGPSRVVTTITYTVSGSSGGGLTKGSSSISGATGKHPKLTVKVSAPHGESITKISIIPPSGFAFVSSALKHGVNVSGATGVLLSHGALAVKLKHSVSAVSAKVSDGALRLSGKVVKKIRKGKLKSVIFTVDASLSTGSIAQLSLSTRL